MCENSAYPTVCRYRMCTMILDLWSTLLQGFWELSFHCEGRVGLFHFFVLDFFLGYHGYWSFHLLRIRAQKKKENLGRIHFTQQSGMEKHPDDIGSFCQIDWAFFLWNGQISLFLYNLELYAYSVLGKVNFISSFCKVNKKSLKIFFSLNFTKTFYFAPVTNEVLSHQEFVKDAILRCLFR